MIYFLNKCDPISSLSKRSSGLTFWANLGQPCKKCHLCSHGFPLIGLVTLFSNCIKLSKKVIKSNILNKIHEDWGKNVTNRMLTLFLKHTIFNSHILNKFYEGCITRCSGELIKIVVSSLICLCAELIKDIYYYVISITYLWQTL